MERQRTEAQVKALRRMFRSMGDVTLSWVFGCIEWEAAISRLDDSPHLYSAVLYRDSEEIGRVGNYMTPFAVGIAVLEQIAQIMETEEFQRKGLA